VGGDGGVKESGVGALIKRIERRKLFGGGLGMGGDRGAGRSNPWMSQDLLVFDSHVSSAAGVESLVKANVCNTIKDKPKCCPFYTPGIQLLLSKSWLCCPCAFSLALPFFVFIYG